MENNLYYFINRNSEWQVKKIGEFDKEGNSIILQRFKTKEEAEKFIKELEKNNGQ